MRPGRAFVVAVALAILAAAPPARADFFSQSPGPLATPHAALEGRDHCNACHTDGRGLANEKCLTCHEHEGIRRRILDGKGFHASGKVAGKDCFLCHTEHKGRGKDILGFVAIGGRERFDHALTGWPLVESHAGVDCNRCHTRRTGLGARSYLFAFTACEGCHTSPHGELRASLQRCARCHQQRDWRPLAKMDFDHDAPSDARYPIEARHKSVTCLQCHPKSLFRAPGFAAPDCTPCHAAKHGDSLFGTGGKKKCAACHSAKVAWPEVRFDHARGTKFPLEGAHASAACRACHAEAARVKPERACATCHRDVHKGRFSSAAAGGGECGACHGASSWKDASRFDHARAGFVLTGRHSEIACRTCHGGSSPGDFEKLTSLVQGGAVACMGCHTHESVHKKQFQNGECLRCHLVAGKNKFRKEAVDRFHGPASRFPLNEGHARVACEKCHVNDVYEGTPVECGPACHGDDLHKGTLGQKCSGCHEGGHWRATRFDHDNSDFPLIGHHQQTACADCHPSRRFKPVERACKGCHAADDAHQGTLGDRCERCHSPTGRSLFDHNDPKVEGRFRLEGKHRQVRCQGCHPTTVFPRVATTCEGCHAEPAVHLGKLGTRCGDCHDASDWKKLHTGHELPSLRFGGAHDRLPCERCHEGGASRRGTGALCVTCHRGDDLHANALGPRCGECHGQESWPPVKYLHERSGCSLRGVHRTLPCSSCHVGGNFAALSAQCVACHRADAVKGAKAPGAPMGHAGLTQCAACHNPNFFSPSRGQPGESVCR